MKETRGIRCHWIWIWLPTLGRQVIPNGVRATDWLVISLFEFAKQIAQPPALVGRQTGAFGLTSGFGEFLRVLRSQDSMTRAIKSAAQRIKEEDRRPPVRECPPTPRPKVLAGFLARGISASALFIRQICRGIARARPTWHSRWVLKPISPASGFVGLNLCPFQCRAHK